jgi:3-methyladenine DNA glycosylase AlkD
MNQQELFQDIDAFCRANANELIVKKYSRYFKTGYDAYGLTSGLLHVKADEILADPANDLEKVMLVAPLLLKTGKYEHTSFAIVLLMSFRKQFSKNTFTELGHWFEIGITNWGHTDLICSEMMQVFFKKGIIDYKDFSEWKTAKNKFQRRAVPVSLIKELKKTTDYKPFLDFLDSMMLDPEREVHQGLGWFLREAWKKQPMQIEPFLEKWKNSAARLIFQYACEKMSPAEKQRYKKEK